MRNQYRANGSSMKAGIPLLETNPFDDDLFAKKDHLSEEDLTYLGISTANRRSTIEEDSEPFATFE
jgi:hypothetical protein